MLLKIWYTFACFTCITDIQNFRVLECALNPSIFYCSLLFIAYWTHACLFIVHSGRHATWSFVCTTLVLCSQKCKTFLFWSVMIKSPLSRKSYTSYLGLWWHLMQRTLIIAILTIYLNWLAEVNICFHWKCKNLLKGFKKRNKYL